MGLTLIQRSSGIRPPKNPKIALVLAGGAVSGGAFKVGGLKALDEFLVGRKVTELDTYIGLSAGAFLATSLAAGITPDEMIQALDGTSERLDQLRPIDFYNPNVGELIGRGAVFGARMAAYLPGLLLDLLSMLPELPARLGPSVRKLVDEPSYTHFESVLMQLYEEVSPKREFPPLGALLPSGLFDNAPLERWLATNMAKLGVPNYFSDFYRETGRKLYITATNLDTAERVLFGPENDHGLTISQAVQASAALPGFFKPARINGVDYVDGGVRRTANIDVAVEQGADLIICYNPFRPYLNDPHAPGRVGSRYLADRGLQTVMNQVLRTLLHTRLAMGLRAYMYDEHFRGDIVVIEARESDEKFFDLNPLVFWRRADAVEHGLESVRRTLLDSVDVLQPIFARYGLDFRAPASAGRPAPAPERDARPSLRVVSSNAAG
ncbi:MAG TPA: patatin-like phospholipase family protein [Myxococcota bacterium]|nr:patatin-like phospholipase family protein [Myxococcota bacterium]